MALDTGTSRRQLFGESWSKSERWAASVRRFIPRCLLLAMDKDQTHHELHYGGWQQQKQREDELYQCLSSALTKEPSQTEVRSAEPRLINQCWGQTLVMMRCKMLCSLVLYAPLNWLQGNVRSWAVIRHREGGHAHAAPFKCQRCNRAARSCHRCLQGALWLAPQDNLHRGISLSIGLTVCSLSKSVFPHQRSSHSSLSATLRDLIEGWGKSVVPWDLKKTNKLMFSQDK